MVMSAKKYEQEIIILSWYETKEKQKLTEIKNKVHSSNWVPLVCSQSIQIKNILFFVFLGKRKYCIEHLPVDQKWADVENF